MRIPSFRSLALTCVAIGVGVCAQAAGLEDLTIFKSGGLASGRWSVQMLETTSPEMKKAMTEGGKMSVCTDMAKQVAKSSSDKDSSCTPKILTNTANVAEVETSCANGSHSKVKINKESDKTYLADLLNTSESGETTHSKMRYTYQGECKADEAMIQLDKKSEACKQMGTVDPSACEKAPESFRAQCEQQLKQMAKMCQ